jgi:hypothetical protein
MPPHLECNKTCNAVLANELLKSGKVLCQQQEGSWGFEMDSRKWGSDWNMGWKREI